MAELIRLWWPEVSFAHEWVLWLLVILPLLLVFTLWPRAARRGALAFPAQSLLAKLGKGWRVYLSPLPRFLEIAALALVILVVARPQSPDLEMARVEGIDIYVVLDLSGSMQAVDLNLAQVEHLTAMGEYPKNRFEVAREVLRDFVVGRRERCYDPVGEVSRCDRIGMVVFGEDAFLEFPLTLDYGTVLTLLSQRKLGDIEGSGTAIGNALARAVAGLRHSESKSKVVVIITDGDRRGGDISPAEGAQMARHFGVQVFPILVGREGPTLLPNDVDEHGYGGGYKEIEFPVNPVLLRELAEQTGGNFYRSSDSQSLRQDLHAILDEFEISEHEEIAAVSHTELYPYLLRLAVLLLLLDAALRYLLLRKFP